MNIPGNIFSLTAISIKRDNCVAGCSRPGKEVSHNSTLVTITTNRNTFCLCVYGFWVKIRCILRYIFCSQNTLKHLAMVLICSVAVVAIITPGVGAAYPEVDTVLFSKSVFFNQIVFPIALGIPLTILMQEELGFIPKKKSRKSHHLS